MNKWVRYFAAAVFAVMIALAIAPAFAGDRYTINNYYETPAPVQEVTNLSISNGISHADLLSLSSAVLAGGAHQFDYSTTKWQLSLTGDFHTSDWDADNEFSVGMGKRFGKDSWIPNALFHGAYTPVLDDHHVTLGVTIVLF